MEELRECVFYRPRGGSGRQRRDGILMREQRQRCSEKWHCRHTRDETTKPARAAKRDEAATRNGAESCQTVTWSQSVATHMSAVRTCRVLSERGWHREGHPEHEVGAWQRVDNVSSGERLGVRSTEQKRAIYKVLTIAANRQK